MAQSEDLLHDQHEKLRVTLAGIGDSVITSLIAKDSVGRPSDDNATPIDTSMR